MSNSSGSNGHSSAPTSGAQFHAPSALAVTSRGAQARAHAADAAAQKGSLEPLRIFEGMRLLLLGGTGFLGKIFWCMLLDRYPNVGKIFLLVRGSKGQTSEQRFWSEVATSEALEPLRKAHGAGFDAFLRARIVPIDGDVGRTNAGIDATIIAELRGTIDAVVNLAGVVDFHPPLDEAIDANAFGAKNLVGLCRALGDVALLHTSTCYVVGNRKGMIYEDVPSTYPFPRADELGRELWDPEREIQDCLDIIKAARARGDDAFRQSEFLEKAKKNLLSRGEPTEGSALEAELKQVRRKFVSAILKEAGSERAAHWGWPNTYTYTKSIGEQIIEKSGLTYAIARPACCESTLAFPFPGWNEGMGTSAPIIYLVMKGQHQIIGGDAILDFVPTDTVCAGMLLSLAELLDGTHESVYQYGTSDTSPIASQRIGELIGIYKRKHFQRTGKGNPFVNYLQSRFEVEVVTPDHFEAFGPPQFAKIARVVGGALKQAPGPVAAVGRSAAGALETFAKQEDRIADIVRLFTPFTFDQKGPFSCAHTKAAYDRLPPEEQLRICWQPELLDWADYWPNQHLKAMETRVIPWIDNKYKKELKPLRAHATLASLVHQMAEHHDLQVAFQRLEDSGLSRFTYRDVQKLASSIAKRLQDAGIVKGDRVVLSGLNHPAWPIVFFGIVMAGAVCVPVDPNLEAAGFANVLAECDGKLAIWDAHVEDKSGAALRARAETLAGGAFQLWDLRAALVLAEANADAGIKHTHVDIFEDDVASLIFTSGTTGKPKGVRLSHKNFTHLAASLAPLFPLKTSDRILSVLPLHHTFEFSAGFLLPFSRGTRVIYLDELTGERVTEGLKQGKVTGMVGVPAVWQLLERRILSQIEARGVVVSTLFDATSELNRLLVKNLGLDLGKVLFAPVHEGLGGHLRFLISGGAALGPDTQKLFAGLGFKLTEGYGLTEAAPVLAVAKAGSAAGQVGKAIPGVELRIDNADASGVGEVLARGPNVMLGYTDDEATAQVMTNGWLRTGDLGKFDRKGRLVLAGRSKDVVVTATGENIYPDDVERLLGTIPGIEELALVGMNAPSGAGERLACLAVPAIDESISRAERNERAQKSLRDAIAKLPYGMQPSLVQLYDAKLPRTTTRKVKRNEARAILERTLAAKQRPDATSSGNAKQASPVRIAIASVKGVALEDVHATSTMQGDFGFDSLSLTELLVALEDRFGALDPDQLQACLTVQDVERLVDIAATPSVKPPKAPSRYQIQGVADESDDARIVLPGLLQERGKEVIGRVQDLFYGSVMRSEVVGRANIPHNRNVIVVANHQSHLDMGFVRHALGKFGEDIVSLAASDYFFEREKWKRAFLENFTNLKSLDRKGGLRASERQAGQVLSEGKNMLVFPEGTRSQDGQIHDFKPLVGHLALYYGTDILPMYIGGAADAMPKGAKLPKKRELLARIGPVFTTSDMRRLTAHLAKSEASREVARLSRLAVLALRDGTVIDFAKAKPSDFQEVKEEVHPLVTLFSELEKKFDPVLVKNPVSFYFTLGNDEQAKWTVKVNPDGVAIRPGKPEGGTADCVLKTSPEIFQKIVREAYTPGPAEFISGAIKSNDIALLVEFQRLFQLA